MVWGPSNSSPTTSMTLASSTCSKYHADPVSCQKGVEALSVATGVTLTSPHHHLISPLPLLIPPHHLITPTMSTSHSTPSSPPCSKGHGHLTITPPSPHHYTTPTMLTSQYQNCMDHHLTTGYCPLPLPQSHVTSSPFHQTLQGLHHYSAGISQHAPPVDLREPPVFPLLAPPPSHHQPGHVSGQLVCSGKDRDPS